jgi:hypothetical protein
VGPQRAALRKLESTGGTDDRFGVILPSLVDKPESAGMAESVLLKEVRPPNTVELSDGIYYSLTIR